MERNILWYVILFLLFLCRENVAAQQDSCNICIVKNSGNFDAIFGSVPDNIELSWYKNQDAPISCVEKHETWSEKAKVFLLETKIEEVEK